MSIVTPIELESGSVPSIPGDAWRADVDAVSPFVQLDALSKLPAGWNGYGAEPIDPAIIAAAARFLADLPLDAVGPPRVVPMTRGRIQLEWHRGERSLELEFEDAESLHFLKWDPEAGIEEEDVVPIREAGRVRELLAWFASR